MEQHKIEQLKTEQQKDRRRWRRKWGERKKIIMFSEKGKNTYRKVGMQT